MDKNVFIFKNKNIMLGVTGSIAAYKSAQICSRLTQSGANVVVVMTSNAAKFVSPLTFSSISRNETVVELFSNKDKLYHVSLAHSVDIIILAPATANTISKLACGICDNFLTTTIIAAKCPVVIAPAMNESLYLDPAVQTNISTLKKTGKYFFVGPIKGKLACGESGLGRMEDEDIIIERAGELLQYRIDLAGKKVMITAGGTREDIDTVRYISNYSSGKMGHALAEEAYFRGAEKVILISANKNLPVPYGVDVVYVKSSSDMKNEVLQHFSRSDVTIMAAAISDIIPEKRYGYKLKKKDNIISKLKFKENENILHILADKKGRSQYLVGFSAESTDDVKNTLDKIKGRNIDMAVANDISRKDIGMMSDFNEVAIVTQDGCTKKLAKDKKRIIAREIWDEIIENIKE
jgi:phosphopantothenoylcysteine decarboxylase/phosphopantothenate--cysteine ligase